MVGEFDGVYEIGVLGAVEVAERDDNLGKFVALSLVDTVLEGPPVGEVEVGREALEIGGRLGGAVFPGFADHKHLALAAAGFVGGVAVLVPFFQECHVGFHLVLVNPDDGVQPQAVHAEVYPLVGAGGKGLEGVGLGRFVVRTVVEVRHRLVERCEVPDAAAAESDVGRGAVVDGIGLPEGDAFAAAAPLGAAVPGRAGRTHQEAPVGIHVNGNLVYAGRGLIQAHEAGGAYPEPLVGGGVGALGGGGAFGHGDCLLVPVKLEVKPALVAEVAAVCGVPGAHSRVLGSGVIVYLAGRHVLGPAFGKHVEAAVGAALRRDCALEPFAAAGVV